MASSGSFNTTNYSGRYVKFSWSIKSQSVANNQTVISWSLVGAGDATSGYYNAAPFKVVIDGATVYESSTRIQLYKGTVVASGEKTIKHDTNGKKRFSASASAAIYSFSVNCSGSGTWDLTDIPRAATITGAPASFNDEETELIITYSNPAGNNVTKLEACISLTGAQDDIKYRGIEKTATSYKFSLSEDEKKILRKAVTKQDGTNTVTFFIRTTIGTTQYHNTRQANYYLINFQPTITADIHNFDRTTLELTGNPQWIIKGFNSIEYYLYPEAKKEATITNSRITCGNQTSTDNHGILYNVDTAIFNLRTIDNRNTITENTVTLGLIEYTPLTCQLNASIALDGETTSKISFSANGEYWSGNFGLKDNELRLAYSIKVDNGSYSEPVFITPTTDAANGTFSYSGTIGGLDYKSNYSIKLIAYDSIFTTGLETKEVQLSTTPIFDWGKDNFNFNVPVSINNVELDYITEQGENNGWFYRKWKSGKGECWKTVKINSAISTGWGSMYRADTLMSRQNYPFVFKTKPVEIATYQSGGNAGWLYAESGGLGVNGAYASAVYNVCRPTAMTTPQDIYISLYAYGTL